jgi:hypothetical protein
VFYWPGVVAAQRPRREEPGQPGWTWEGGWPAAAHLAQDSLLPGFLVPVPHSHGVLGGEDQSGQWPGHTHA